MMLNPSPRHLVAFDLDDTLIAERDYVESAWREVAAVVAEKCHLDADEVTNVMLNAADAPGALEAYLAAHGHAGAMTIPEMVEMYRRHQPPRPLPLMPGMERLLRECVDAGAALALVTDGRVGTQTAKIETAMLRRYFAPEDIVISGATGHEKIEPYNFQLLEQRYPGCDRRIYIGNNPSKDFLQPRRLGWTTYCFLDPDGRGIHPCRFEDYGPEYQPHFLLKVVGDEQLEIIPAPQL